MKWLILLAFITPAYAQITDDEIHKAWEACKEHPGREVRPGGWEKGWEICADIHVKWSESERGRVAKELEKKKQDGDAAIRALEQKLKK